MSDTTPSTRIFHSIAAAEEAYRAEVQRNEVFSAKFDVLGAKLDRLTTAIERLSAAMTLAQPQLPSTSSRPLEEITTTKLESTPAPSAKLKPLLLSGYPLATFSDSVKPRPRPLSFSSTASTALIKFGPRRQSLPPPPMLSSDNYATVSDCSLITVTMQSNTPVSNTPVSNTTVSKVSTAPASVTGSITPVNKTEPDIKKTASILYHRFPLSKPRPIAPVALKELYYDSGYESDHDTFAVNDNWSNELYYSDIDSDVIADVGTDEFG